MIPASTLVNIKFKTPITQAEKIAAVGDYMISWLNFHIFNDEFDMHAKLVSGGTVKDDVQYSYHDAACDIPDYEVIDDYITAKLDALGYDYRVEVPYGSEGVFYLSIKSEFLKKD